MYERVLFSRSQIIHTTYIYLYMIASAVVHWRKILTQSCTHINIPKTGWINLHETILLELHSEHNWNGNGIFKGDITISMAWKEIIEYKSFIIII